MPVFQTLDNPTSEQGVSPELRASDCNPEEQLAQRERLQHLKRFLTELPDRDREMLLMDAMSGLPQKEIAAMFDLNLNTVKTTIRRARIKLARRMAEVYRD